MLENHTPELAYQKYQEKGGGVPSGRQLYENLHWLRRARKTVEDLLEQATHYPKVDDPLAWWGYADHWDYVKTTQRWMKLLNAESTSMNWLFVKMRLEFSCKDILKGGCL